MKKRCVLLLILCCCVSVLFAASKYDGLCIDKSGAFGWSLFRPIDYKSYISIKDSDLLEVNIYGLELDETGFKDFVETVKLVDEKNREIPSVFSLLSWGELIVYFQIPSTSTTISLYDTITKSIIDSAEVTLKYNYPDGSKYGRQEIIKQIPIYKDSGWEEQTFLMSDLDVLASSSSQGDSFNGLTIDKSGAFGWSLFHPIDYKSYISIKGSDLLEVNIYGLEFEEAGLRDFVETVKLVDEKNQEIPSVFSLLSWGELIVYFQIPSTSTTISLYDTTTKSIIDSAEVTLKYNYPKGSKYSRDDIIKQIPIYRNSGWESQTFLPEDLEMIYSNLYK